MRNYNREAVPPVMQKFLDNPLPYMMMKQFSPFSVINLGVIWAKFMKITQSYPNVVYLDQISPYFNNVLIVGDTHGDLHSTLRIVQPFLDGQVDSLVFLGDYVDRGEYSFFNLMFLIGLVLAWPDRVVLLRGNHEDLELNQIFGFYDELHTYFPDPHIFRTIVSIIESFYNLMSLVAITPQKSVCVHAGIPKSPNSFHLLQQVPKPHYNTLFFDDKSLIAKIRDVYKQVRWNDPTESPETDNNSRSYHGYFYFTATELQDFLRRNNFVRLYRSHEDPRGGYQEVFPGCLYHLFSNEPYFGKIDRAFVIHEHPTGIFVRDLDFNVHNQIQK